MRIGVISRRVSSPERVLTLTKVHQGQVTTVLLVTADAFVVVHKVATAIDDWLVPVNFDPPGVV